MSDATENVAIRFTPLSGGHSLAPPCYLLEIGGIKLLLDCGWCDPFDVEMLKPLLRVVQDVDAVLLSHGNVEHLGALPYAFEKGLSCPVYCTGPVKTLGHLAMYDAYLSKHYNAPFSVFTPDSIDYAWERLVPLKFSQHLMLEGPGRSGAVVVGGIEITPYAAGHTLGGAVWRIKIGMDEIVYCSHYNHMNERHLDKTILQTLQRPMLLICGSSNALTVHNDKRSDRDKLLFETVATTLRAGGNVLIPMDAVGRVMEVAVLLDTMWQQTRPQGSLVMLSSQAYNVTVATSSLLEWMSKHISKSFQSTADFSLLPSVHRCHSTEDLLRVPQPVVVMASTADLESGFARELFAHWAGNSKNAVVLVDRSLPGTLANSLATSCVQGAALPKTLAVKVSKRVVLAGQELDAYRRTKEIERLQLLERQRLENAKKELSEAQDYDDAREETLDTLTQFVPDNPYFKDATQFDVIPGDLPPGSASPMFPLSRLVAPDVPRADNVGDWSA
jgi:cleavage and polyadenylation specificity factor subunit 2